MTQQDSGSIGDLIRFLSEHKARPAPIEVAMAWRASKEQAALESSLKHSIAKNADHDTAHMLLIQMLGWQGRQVEAGTIVDQWLSKRSGFSRAQLKNHLAELLGFKNEEISTYYNLSKNSLQSLGFYHHVCHSQIRTTRLITKIVHAELAGNEPTFYSRIAPKHPSLWSIAPRLIDIQHLPELRLVLITMEESDGRICETASLTESGISGLVKACRIVSDVPINELFGILDHPGQELGFNHGLLVSSLRDIHLPENWSRLNMWIRDAVAQSGYSDMVHDAVIQSLDVATRNRLSECIDPSRHYGFLHGDLHRHNVLISNSGPMFIDWARCSIGPRGADLAILLRRFGYSVVINHAYKGGIIPSDDRVSIGLLSLALIVVSLQIDISPIKEEHPEFLFLPATRMLMHSC